MTSAKVNRAIIDSILISLSRANFDPLRVRLIPVNTGFFLSADDRRDVDRAPRFILKLLNIEVAKGKKFTNQEMKEFVENRVWEKSFTIAKGNITFALAGGKNPKRYIQEAREALQALRALGDKEGTLYIYERSLKEVIGEI